MLFTIGAAEPENAQIALLDLQTGQHTTLLRGGRDAQYVASGHLVYLAGRAMSAVRFDLLGAAVVGDPVRVIDGVAASPTERAERGGDPGGHARVHTGRAPAPRRCGRWCGSIGRGTRRRLAAPPRPYESARLSPDGTRIAVSIRDQENDIWIWDLARKTLTRLTFDADIDLDPVWTPDSRRVVFASARTGVVQPLCARRGRFGAGRTTDRPARTRSCRLGDARRRVRHRPRGPAATKSDLVRFALAPGPVAGAIGGGRSRRNAVRGMERRGLAGRPLHGLPVGRIGADRGLRAALSASQRRALAGIVAAAARSRVWTRGGRELILSSTAHIALTAVPVDAGGGHVSRRDAGDAGHDGLRRRCPWRAYDVSPDGQRFLVMKEDASRPQDVLSAGFVVVQNWFEELKRLVPAK